MGSYDVLIPDRAWLLGLARRHGVEAIFCGHTHFRFFNRLGATRYPRRALDHDHAPGFLRGHLDFATGSRVGRHRQARLLPCAGDGRRASRCTSSGPVVIRRCPKTGGRPCLTATTQELPRSPLGAYLRLPLANESDGAIVYPYHVRHRVAGRSSLSWPASSSACATCACPSGTWSARCSASASSSCKRRVCRSPRPSSRTAAMSSRIELHGWLRHARDPDRRSHRAPTDRRWRRSDDCTADRKVSLAPIVMESTGTVHNRSRTGYRVHEIQGAQRGAGSPGHPHRSRGVPR